MILSPYFWLVAILSALLLFAGGYDLGAEHARNKAASDQREAIEVANQKAATKAQADQKTALQYEKARETVRTVYVKIKEKARENIIKNPDYAECGLDADGLQLYNSHPNDRKDASTGIDGPVSGSASSPGRQTVDNTDQQPGANSDVLRLPGASQSTDGMGGTGIEGT